MKKLSASEYPTLSVVTPAFNEARNLLIFYERLTTALGAIEISWEWIIVDDHSSDATFQILQELTGRDARVQAVRLTRNFGSHAAIGCGLEYACGQAVAVMAVDLQDPPELLGLLIERWREGFPVVWAVRRTHREHSLNDRLFSRLYYLALRKMTGLKDIPADGADFLLMDRIVIENLRRFPEAHNDLFTLIRWMGFEHTTIEYDKQARLHGNSGWTFHKKINLVIDSITAFSDAPMRWIAWLGFATAGLGCLYAGIIFVNALAGHPPAGWSSLMMAIILIGGIQMLVAGVMGQYVWRALSESRRRPRFIIERTCPEIPAQNEISRKL